MNLIREKNIMGDKNPKAKTHSGNDRMPRISTRRKRSGTMTTGRSSNPTPPAPTVLRAREKAAAKIAAAKSQEGAIDIVNDDPKRTKAAQATDFRTAQAELATKHPGFQALQPGTTEFRVAVEVLTHFALIIELKPGEKRLQLAYQAARKTLDVVQRQKPQDREVRIWHGRQVAVIALTWAYTQLTDKSTTPTREIVDYTEFVFGVVPIRDCDFAEPLEPIDEIKPVDLDSLIGARA